MTKARAQALNGILSGLAGREEVDHSCGMKLKNACGTNSIISTQLLATVNSSNYTFNYMMGNGEPGQISV